MYNALEQIDPTFTSDLQEVFNSAKSENLWNNTYSAYNAGEYWAEGVTTFFDAKEEGLVGGDGIYNDINTRVELAQYDPRLYCLIKRVYTDAHILNPIPSHVDTDIPKPEPKSEVKPELGDVGEPAPKHSLVELEIVNSSDTKDNNMFLANTGASVAIISVVALLFI